MLRRLTAFLALAFALAGAAAAVTLHRGNNAEPDTLDPHKYGLTVELAILQDMFEGLVMPGPDGKPVPGIAESWTISEDGRVYTFKIRPGLTWSDGAPLTMDDIVMGFRRTVDPATAAQLVDLCFVVKNARAISEGKLPPDQIGVLAIDDLTLEVTMEQPSGTFIRRLGGFSLFFPVPTHIMQKFGEEWVKPGNMVTNGPYVLAEWTPQSRVRLVKNQRFREAGSVAIDEVIFYPTVDDAAAVKQFRNGELDLNLGFPPGQHEWLKANMPAETRADPASQITFITLNTTIDKFKDPRVRRALSLAVDRETITYKILNNGQLPGYSIFPSIVENWAPPPEDDFSQVPLSERQDEARRLLEEAGYGPGNPLVFQLDYRGSDPNKRVVVAIAAMWKAIGVTAELQANEVKTHYAKLRQTDYEAADAGWQGTPEPEFFVNLLQTGSETNYGKWSNAEFDRIIGEAVATLNPEQRKALFQQADRIAIEETAEIVLFYNAQRALVQTWVKGFEGNPGNAHPTRYMRVER